MVKTGILIVLLFILIITPVSAGGFGYDASDVEVKSAGTSTVNVVTGNLTAFTQLTDTPGSYAGEGTNCVKVNAGATALEFAACAGGGDVSNNTAGLTLNFSAIFSLDWSNVTITQSQITDLSHFNVTYDALVTNNESWNETYADTLYAPAGSGNASWNQTLAETLYAGIEWDYNETLIAQAYADANMTIAVLQSILNSTGIYSTYNVTYDAGLNPNWNQSYAESLFWNISLGSQNDTYDALVTDDANWNLTYADTLYAGIEWDYNQTDATVTLHNLSWSSTYNATYDATVGDNSSWNQTFAATLFWAIASGSYNATYDALVTNDANWNKTYADTLYAGIAYAYNFTTATFGLYNATWDNSFMNIWNYNQTTATITLHNTSWSSTFNVTYDALVTNNESWNETYADALYFLLDQGNWNTDSYLYWDSGNANLTFNTSKLETTYYNATQSTNISGLITGGSLGDTQHQDGAYDGETFNFSEVVGSPGLDLRINFTEVSDFSQGVIRYKTGNLFGDYPIIQVWSYTGSEWEDYPPLAESETFATITQPVFDTSSHLENGVVQIRLYKAANGNVNNDYYVDWVSIADGFAVPSGEEVDPYSYHRDENINATGYNVSADFFEGDGSLLINLPSSDNASWNESHAGTLYAGIGVTGDNASWNESYGDTLYWDILKGSFNSSYDALVTDDANWNRTFAETLFWNISLGSYNTTYASLVTDDANWNKTYADTLYAPISVDGDFKFTDFQGAFDSNFTGDYNNDSWNQTFAATLFWAIADGSYNATYDALTTFPGWTNVAWINQTNTFAPVQVMQSNLTVEMIVLETDATHNIFDNATCTTITGDTATLEVC